MEGGGGNTCVMRVYVSIPASTRILPLRVLKWRLQTIHPLEIKNTLMCSVWFLPPGCLSLLLPPLCSPLNLFLSSTPSPTQDCLPNSKFSSITIWGLQCLQTITTYYLYLCPAPTPNMVSLLSLNHYQQGKKNVSSYYTKWITKISSWLLKFDWNK